MERLECLSNCIELDQTWSTNSIRTKTMEKFRQKLHQERPRELVRGRINQDVEDECNRRGEPRHSLESNPSGYQEGPRQISIYSGSQKGKWWDRFALVQDGNPSTNNQDVETRLVWDKDRPFEGIFSHSNPQRLQKATRIRMEGKDLSIQCSSIWTLPSTNHVHQDHQTSCEEMEGERLHGIRLHRRFLNSPPRQRNLSVNHESSSRRSAIIRFQDTGVEMHLNTYTEPGISGSPVEFPIWNDRDTNTEERGCIRTSKFIHPTCPVENQSNMSNSSQVNRKIGIFEVGRATNSSFPTQIEETSSHNDFIKQLEQFHDDTSKQFEGSKNPVSNNSDLNRKSFRTGLEFDKSLLRQFTPGLWNCDTGFNNDWILGEDNRFNQCSGIKNDEIILPESSNSKVISSSHSIPLHSRQYECTVIPEQGIWSQRHVSLRSKDYFQDSIRNEVENLESVIHPLRDEHNSRYSLQDGRMANISGIISFPQFPVWPVHSRPLCFSGQPPCSEVQFMEYPVRCFQRELEYGQQLHGPTTRDDPFNAFTNNQEPSEGFIDYSRLEELLVVSCSAKTLSKDRSIREKDAQSIALIRAREELRMDSVLSCSSRRELVLDKLRNICLESQYSYEYCFKLWRCFKRFQSFRYWMQLPFNVHSTELFILDELLIGKGWEASVIKSSLIFFSNLLKIPFEWKPELNGLITGVTRVYNRTEKKSLKRDGILIEHITRWINEHNPLSDSDKFEKQLISSILIIGFRTLYRPSDLASIKWNDVQFDKPKANLIQVTNLFHKTDKEGKDQDPNIIEPSGVEICPVRILKEYRNSVMHFKSSESPFLSYMDNLFLRGNDINLLICKMRKILNISEKIHGHSMRIGAATKIASEGEGMDTVQYAGNWKSTAFRSYVHQNHLVARHLSTTLFRDTLNQTN